jgi:hypothetical protein
MKRSLKDDEVDDMDDDEGDEDDEDGAEDVVQPFGSQQKTESAIKVNPLTSRPMPDGFMPPEMLAILMYGRFSSDPDYLLMHTQPKSRKGKLCYHISTSQATAPLSH